MFDPSIGSRKALFALTVLGSLAAATAAVGQTKQNAACPSEVAYYDPGHGEDIAVPEGYQVEVFARDLNFPTGLAFLGDKNDFQVLVVESGTGLPSACNDNRLPAFGGKYAADNPFTPDLIVFDKHGNRIGGPRFKPTSLKDGYQADGPAIGLAFENGPEGGTLFATDSNQGIRGAGFGKGNNSSRVLKLHLGKNEVEPYITGLPTGDHPTELIIVKDGYLYWSQGSATNAGVTGHDNGGGGNQHDIACQQITLSQNTWSSGADGHVTTGYSNHNTSRPGATVPAFEDATAPGMCTGAILRSKISDPSRKVQPFSWGYRNPFGLRFAPKDHALKGNLFVTENGEDERGARPTNGVPDRLQIARMNPDDTPDYHGWPDRFGFLDSTQAAFNPKGGPADDAPALVANKPVLHVLAFPPQPPVAPIALEPADVAAVGPDFAPNSFVHGVVRKGAALVAREGDFGFSPGNGTPDIGHDVELVNFSKPGEPFRVELERFAFNCKKADQFHEPGGHAACHHPQDMAFTEEIHGINRPLQNLFGPDGALYVVDYGAVRDFGQSDPKSRFTNPADAPLAQIPGTGTIFRITRIQASGDAPGDGENENDD